MARVDSEPEVALPKPGLSLGPGPDHERRNEDLDSAMLIGGYLLVHVVFHGLTEAGRLDLDPLLLEAVGDEVLLNRLRSTEAQKSVG